jgi:hypothetical protein
LVDLFAGLIDRDKGRLAPLLSPTKSEDSGNRHTDAALLQMMQGCAIFAIEQLVKMGNSVEDSKEQVTKIWNKRSGEPRKSGTIKSWYNRRDKRGKDDLAFEALTNLRVFWHPEGLDKPSADFVRNALRANELSDNLNAHLPHTPAGILEFLARTLTAIKLGHTLIP